MDCDKSLPVPDERYGLASELFRRLQSVRRQWDLFVPPPPLNRSDMMMLGLVEHLHSHDEKGITVSLLARITGQTLPAVSQKVSSIEAQGLIRRVASKSDRRSARIEPTPKGLETARQAMDEFFGRLQKALDRLGPEKVEKLLGQLDEFAEVLQAVLQEPANE